MSLQIAVEVLGFFVSWAVLTRLLTRPGLRGETGVSLRRPERVALYLAFVPLLLVIPLLFLWDRYEPDVSFSTKAGILYVAAITLGQLLLFFGVAGQPQWLRRPVRWGSVLMTVGILAYAVLYLDDQDFLSAWGAGVATFIAFATALSDELGRAHIHAPGGGPSNLRA